MNGILSNPAQYQSKKNGENNSSLKIDRFVFYYEFLFTWNKQNCVLLESDTLRNSI